MNQTMNEKYGPLKKIIDRPSQILETLECGHTIKRSYRLGEDLQVPSRAKRRRCYECIGK